MALSLPLLCLLLLGVVQVAVVARDQLAVQLVARDAARRAAAGDRPGDAAASVALSPVHVGVRRVGDMVVADAVFVEHTDVPLIGVLLPDVTVRATATMRAEDAPVAPGSGGAPPGSSP